MTLSEALAWLHSRNGSLVWTGRDVHAVLPAACYSWSSLIEARGEQRHEEAIVRAVKELRRMVVEAECAAPRE